MAMKNDPRQKLRVGLLFGGRSGEHEVSLASAMSLYSALDKSRYEVTLIAIDKDGRWLLPDPQPLLAHADNPMLVKFAKTSDSFGVVPYPNERQIVPVEDSSSLGPTEKNASRPRPPIPHMDIIIPILHGTFGEDGTVQGLLELAAIPYVGSGVLGSALGMDKDVASRLFQAAGIATVPSLCLRKHEYLREKQKCTRDIRAKFAIPFFVKPANTGSSVGVHKVKQESDLIPALDDAFAFDTKVLVQKGIQARELEVSVLGNDEPRASIVGEIIPHHEFYSYEAKYLDENGAELCIPARDLPDFITQKARDWAVLAFQTLECRGMARVDFFLDKVSGELYINEINTIPGFTRISMYPKLWEASGLPYRELLDELIRLALENAETRRRLKTSI